MLGNSVLIVNFNVNIVCFMCDCFLTQKAKEEPKEEETKEVCTVLCGVLCIMFLSILLLEICPWHSFKCIINYL